MRPTLRVFALLATVLAVHLASNPQLANSQPPRPISPTVGYHFGLWGDLPYTPQGIENLPNLIADMNRHQLAFSVFDGDLKSGSTLCSDDWFLWMRDQFNSMSHPLVFVPGDNDWTDCHRPNNGGYDPLERLDYLRATYYPDAYSLGQRRMLLDRQSDRPGYEKFRENVRWTLGEVICFTLNVQGSNNNLQRNLDQALEYFGREEANLVWMRESFGQAQRDNSRAVMLIIQANPAFEVIPDQRSGFNSFLEALEREVKAFFPKPVVLVHGDSHYFRIDKPLMNSTNQRRLENFTRVETFGQNDDHWVRVTVDYSDPNVFTFRQGIVEANLVDHSR